MEKVVLRGHHLLCIHGFRGMGYSPEFVVKMREIVQNVRNTEIDFPIQVVCGFDDTCLVCPNKGSERCEADPTSEEHVQFMDRSVLAQLGLVDGEVYQKSYLVSVTSQKVAPDDLDHLCKGCSWLTYGVCKEGIQELREEQ